MTNKGYKLVNCRVSFDTGEIDVITGKPKFLIVGGVQELSVSRKDDNTITYEAGSLEPLDIISGKRSYTGTVKHLWLLTSAIKDYQNFNDNVTDDAYFNIKGTVNNDDGRSILIEDVRFNGLDINMTLDDVTSASRSFDARRLKLN